MSTGGLPRESTAAVGTVTARRQEFAGENYLLLANRSSCSGVV